MLCKFKRGELVNCRTLFQESFFLFFKRDQLSFSYVLNLLQNISVNQSKTDSKKQFVPKVLLNE